MVRFASFVLLLILIACGAAPESAQVAPTDTPLPTVVPLSAAALSYVVDAERELRTYREWIGKLGQKSTEASTNPSLVMDDTWKIQVAAAVTALRLAADDMNGLDPGDSEATELDRILRQIAQENKSMTAEYLQGVDDFDATLIRSAAQRIEKIDVWLDDADAEIRSLR